jgi:septal ring factor EnvC (AmiA/AmiB activator)
MTDRDEDPRIRAASAFRFVPEINITGIATLLVIIGTVIAWAVTSANHTDQAARDLGAVQTSVAAQITDLKANLAGGLQDVHSQISTLPDQRAKLDTLERRVTDLETRFNVFNDRLTAIERSEIETRADIAPLLRASNMPQPRR